MGATKKRISAALSFALLAALYGCGLSNTPEDPSSDTTDAPMADANHIVLKSASGHDIVAMDSVTALDVTVYRTLGPNALPQTSASFSGAAAQKVVHQLALNMPQEKGAPASIETGMLVIHYKAPGSSQETTRKFWIEGDQVLEDPTYIEVIYNQSRPLNTAWLKAQAAAGGSR